MGRENKVLSCCLSFLKKTNSSYRFLCRGSSNLSSFSLKLYLSSISLSHTHTLSHSLLFPFTLTLFVRSRVLATGFTLINFGEREKGRKRRLLSVKIRCVSQIDLVIQQTFNRNRQGRGWVRHSAARRVMQAAGKARSQTRQTWSP